MTKYAFVCLAPNNFVIEVSKLDYPQTQTIRVIITGKIIDGSGSLYDRFMGNGVKLGTDLHNTIILESI